MKTKIIQINKLLISFFGVPKKNSIDPDPLDMIIATILSQNTNDTNSYKAYKQLKQKYPDWSELINTPRTKIESIIRVAGLGKQKSAAIKNLISELSNRNKKISLDYLFELSSEEVLTELTSFKGVGTKTSACVLLFSMKRDICPVDTHVHRTLNRIGLVKTSTPDKTFTELHKDFPKGIAHSFHTNLIRLGREVCKAGKPNCSICPLNIICTYTDKNYSGSASTIKKDFMLLDNVS